MYGDTTLADRTKDIVLERAVGLDLASSSSTKTNNGLWACTRFPTSSRTCRTMSDGRPSGSITASPAADPHAVELDTAEPPVNSRMRNRSTIR